MAHGAQLGRVRQNWLYFGGIFRVNRLGAMTRFARQVSMLAAGELRMHIVMTGFAGLMTGEGDGLGSHIVQRARPEVAVLAESGGDDHLPGNEEDDNSNGE